MVKIPFNSKMQIKKSLKFILSIVILAISLYFTFRGIEFDKLWDILKVVNYFWLILVIPFMLLSHWLRAWRWRTILKPILENKPISIMSLFSSVMIGYAANCLIPRSGEIFRPYVFSKRAQIPFSSSLATIIFERFIDILFLLFLVIAVLLFYNEQFKQLFPNLNLINSVYPALILLVIIVVSLNKSVVMLLLNIFIKPLSKKIQKLIIKIYMNFSHGFTIIKNPSLYFRLSIESILIWFSYCIPIYLLFFSFGFQKTFDLSFYDAIALMIIGSVGTAIAPTPAAIGVYHLIIQNALVILNGLSREEALAFAIFSHAIGFFILIITGYICFIQEDIKILSLKQEINSSQIT